MLACVAWQERMWKGESIEISKCRRLDGSWASGLERRMTICDSYVSHCTSFCRAPAKSYLDPVMHLDILIRRIKMQALIPITLLHRMTAG